MFIINTSSTCFGHHYAHLQETKTCVTARGVLRWFCWMWLVAVVGRCVVGCEQCEGYCSTLVGCEHCEGRTVTFTVLAPYNAVAHNHYQPHPAEPAQHTVCSNTRLGLLKLGIMMPETCWESVDNKHLSVASCWFSLSLHNIHNIALLWYDLLCCDTIRSSHLPVVMEIKMAKLQEEAKNAGLKISAMKTKERELTPE